MVTDRAVLAILENFQGDVPDVLAPYGAPRASNRDRPRPRGAFLAETYRRRVERVEAFSWGELVSTPSLPRVWDANFAIVSDWDGTAAELGREMDSVQARRASRIAGPSSRRGARRRGSGRKSSSSAGTSRAATY